MTALVLCAMSAMAAGPVEMPRAMTPPMAIDRAAISTHLRFRQGGGLLWIPGYKMPGWPGKVNLAMAGALESLEFQGAPSARSALYGRVGGQVITGLNLDSAFLQGAQSSGFIELGGRYALAAGPKHLVTGRVLVSGSRGAGLTPEPLASAFAKDRWDTLSAVLDGNVLNYVLGQRRGLALGVGVSTAVPLSEVFGVLGSATVRAGRVSYTAPNEEPGRTSRTQASAGVGVDWRPAGKVPLGLLVELHDRQEQEGWLAGDLRATQENRALLATTLAYTGREDLHLGLSAAVLAPTLKPGTEQLYTVEATFQYGF